MPSNLRIRFGGVGHRAGHYLDLQRNFKFAPTNMVGKTVVSFNIQEKGRESSGEEGKRCNDGALTQEAMSSSLEIEEM